MLPTKNHTRHLWTQISCLFFTKALTASVKVSVPWYTRGMSSWSSQHLLYGEGLMETVCCRFPRLLNRVYLIHKHHVVCVWQLHESREQMFVIMKPSKYINHSRLMKSHESLSRYREQLKDNRVMSEKLKLLTHLQCVLDFKHDIVVDSGWDGLHFLPSETAPVIPQNIMNPARQRLITVTGHLWTLLRILDTHREKNNNTQYNNVTVKVHLLLWIDLSILYDSQTTSCDPFNTRDMQNYINSRILKLFLNMYMKGKVFIFCWFLIVWMLCFYW